jgi:hypothetical protein
VQEVAGSSPVIPTINPHPVAQLAAERFREAIKNGRACMARSAHEVAGSSPVIPTIVTSHVFGIANDLP